MPDPEAAFAALFGGDTSAFWLDSARVISGLSRFSMMGGASGPLAETLSYRVEEGEVIVRGADGSRRSHQETIFTYLERTLGQRRIPDAGLPTAFNLGYVGYLGYELKADCGAAVAHRSPQPDAQLIFCDRALVIDHQEQKGWLLTLSAGPHAGAALAWFDEAQRLLSGLRPLP